MIRIFQGMPTAAIAFAALATAAVAQSVSAQDKDLASALDRIDSGVTIRLQVLGEGEFTGRYAGETSDSLVVIDEQGEHRLPANRVAALWKQGTASLRGLQTGGGIGLSLGLIAGLVATAISGWELCLFGPCEEDRNPADWKYTLYGAAAGTLTGAVIGTAVGATKEDWLLLYKSPDYREALWSYYRAEDDVAESHSQNPAEPAAPQSARLADAHRPERERLSLKLAPDANGRVMLKATLAF